MQAYTSAHQIRRGLRGHFFNVFLSGIPSQAHPPNPPLLERIYATLPGPKKTYITPGIPKPGTPNSRSPPHPTTHPARSSPADRIGLLPYPLVRTHPNPPLSVQISNSPSPPLTLPPLHVLCLLYFRQKNSASLPSPHLSLPLHPTAPRFRQGNPVPPSPTSSSLPFHFRLQVPPLRGFPSFPSVWPPYGPHVRIQP